MDIKEIGACAVVVIGGLACGVSSGGLKDALLDDVKDIRKVSYSERAAYMNELVADFSDAFEIYIIQSETHDLVGVFEFSASPRKATFVEVVTAQEPVPSGELAGIRSQIGEGFCEQEEMTMLTDKGWSYDFTLRNANGRQISAIFCKPDPNKFNFTDKIS